MNIITFLHDLVNYGFLRKALFTSVTVGVTAGVIGSFIILRGMSLMGDAISHAILPGVAISYMLNLNHFIGAVLVGLLTAFGVGYISQNSKLKSDTSIGIVFSSFFALGILLLLSSNGSRFNPDLIWQCAYGSSGEMWLTLV